MQELSTEVKNEWLTIKEAAEFLGVTINAIHQNLLRYPEVKEVYTRREGDEGPYLGKRDTRPILISKTGLTLLFASLDSARGTNDLTVIRAKKDTKRGIIKKGVESMEQVIQLSQRVAELEAIIKPKQLLLLSPGLQLPAPKTGVPELSTRARVKQRISLYVEEMYPNPETRPDDIHHKLWNRLYGDFNGRYGFNVNARKRGKEATIDVIERLGKMEELYAVACYLYPTSSDAFPF